jgi:hypothetical protein
MKKKPKKTRAALLDSLSKKLDIAGMTGTDLDSMRRFVLDAGDAKVLSTKKKA